jgi:hypothetical protein
MARVVFLLYLKNSTDFLGNYPQMILPDNCKGNLILLLNLLFCADHGANVLIPTPATQVFCADRLYGVLNTNAEDAEDPQKKPRNIVNAVPGAFKEVVRYFVDKKKENARLIIRNILALACNEYETHRILDSTNPLVLQLVRTLALKTRIFFF